MSTIKKVLQTKLKMLLFLIGISLAHQTLMGQTKKIHISCVELEKLINPDNGKSPLYRFNLDSIIYFVDPSNLLADCKIERWNNRKVQVITSGSAIDSLRNFNPHGVFYQRGDYFLLTIGHYDLNKSIRFLHPASNEFCAAELKRTKTGNIVKNIQWGVY